MTLKYEYGLELGFHRPNSRMEHCTTEMLNDAFGAPPAPPATPDAPEPAPETYYDRAVKQYLSYGLPPASAKRHASSDIRKRIEHGYTMPEEPRMITRGSQPAGGYEGESAGDGGDVLRQAMEGCGPRPQWEGSYPMDV